MITSPFRANLRRITATAITASALSIGALALTVPAAHAEPADITPTIVTPPASSTSTGTPAPPRGPMAGKVKRSLVSAA